MQVIGLSATDCFFTYHCNQLSVELLQYSLLEFSTMSYESRKFCPRHLSGNVNVFYHNNFF